MGIEKGQVITFEDTTWFVEDIKSLDSGENILILSKSDIACTNSIEITSQKYTCADCAIQGELNTKITYHGDDYVCWPCFEQREEADILDELIALLEVLLKKLKE